MEERLTASLHCPEPLPLTLCLYLLALVLCSAEGGMGPGCISHLVGQSSCFQADFFKGIVSLKLVSPVLSIELLFSFWSFCLRLDKRPVASQLLACAPPTSLWAPSWCWELGQAVEVCLRHWAGSRAHPGRQEVAHLQPACVPNLDMFSRALG